MNSQTRKTINNKDSNQKRCKKTMMKKKTMTKGKRMNNSQNDEWKQQQMMMKKKIPTPITLATAGFCGLLKNGTQGLKNKFNKLAFQAAGVECSNRRFGHDKLVLSQRGRHLLADANYSAALEPHDIAEESHRKLLATKSARYGTCAMHGDCDLKS